jgi:hypothetical protein
MCRPPRRRAKRPLRRSFSTTDGVHYSVVCVLLSLTSHDSSFYHTHIHIHTLGVTMTSLTSLTFARERETRADSRRWSRGTTSVFRSFGLSVGRSVGSHSFVRSFGRSAQPLSAIVFGSRAASTTTTTTDRSVAGFGENEAGIGERRVVRSRARRRRRVNGCPRWICKARRARRPTRRPA